MEESLSVKSKVVKDPRKLKFPLQSTVFRVQRVGADSPPEDMHDGQRLQSSVRDD